MQRRRILARSDPIRDVPLPEVILLVVLLYFYLIRALVSFATQLRTLNAQLSSHILRRPNSEKNFTRSLSSNDLKVDAATAALLSLLLLTDGTALYHVCMGFRRIPQVSAWEVTLDAAGGSGCSVQFASGRATVRSN